MASFKSLHLPGSLAAHHGTTRTSTSTTSINARNSMTAYASAHGSCVIGTLSQMETDTETKTLRANEENHTDVAWIKWTTNLQCNVSEVASNHDGSIIAASTSDGSVSILRGNNGDVLVTKSISSSDEEFSHGITFVQNNTRHNANDILAIYKLNRGQNGPVSMDMILVSNINGDESGGTTSTSAGRQVDGLKLDLGGDASSTVSVVQSCFIGENTVRFIVSDQDGVLSVHDYDTHTKESRVVKNALELNAPSSPLSLSNEKGEEDGNGDNTQAWQFVSRAGIHLDLYNPNSRQNFIVVLGKSEGRGMIFWIDLLTLEVVCRYQVKNNVNGASVDVDADLDCEIHNLCPVMPCFDDTVAIALVLRSDISVSGSRVVLLQGVIAHKIEKDDLMKMTDVNENKRYVRIENIHEIHSIQVVEENSPFHAICIVDCSNSFPNSSANTHTNSAEFKVRCKVWSGASIAYREFRSGTKHTIAHIRLHIARNELDEADELAAKHTNAELSTTFGSFHSSEVVLMRFKSMLSNDMILSEENKEQMKECLHRLKFGAVSGGSSGVKSLVEASRTLHCWSNVAGPHLRDYRLALFAMKSCISNASLVVSSKHKDVLRQEMQILESKALVLKTIETVFDSKKSKVRLSAPLLQVNNHIELYNLLISKGAFKVAESVRQAEVLAQNTMNSADQTIVRPKTITPEVVAASVTNISPLVDPNAYCAWLQNVVFPGLTINHHILQTLFIWSCEVADSFDQDGSYGIDSSISLLETVCSSVIKLNVKSHGSFASYSPFSGNPESSNGIPAQIALNQSIDSQHSSSSRSRDHSLLNSALRTKCDNIMDLDLDESSLIDEKCGSFKTKLVHAKIIKAARDYGLPAQSLRLSSFQGNGGAGFAAKELVRIYFNNCWGDYLADHSEDQERVKGFCAFANVSFDEAVEQYSKELCSDENIDASTLSRASDLVTACANPDVKCKITLRFVRTAQVSSSKPSCLKLLAKEAVQWATNEELRSELQEASRLLGIDEILRRYCGNKAPDVFRVSDPVHSARLVAYVARKIIAPSVLADILYLCSAFTHLSAVDHCSVLLERMILRRPTTDDSQMSSACIKVIREIQTADTELAERVAVRACTFCVQNIENLDGTVDHIFDQPRKRHESFCSAAISLCREMSLLSPQGSILNCNKSLRPESSKHPWLEFMREFERMHELNREFGVSISLRMLRSWTTHDSLTKNMVEEAMIRADDNNEETSSGNNLKLILTKARRGCGLLFGSIDCNVITSRWCKAVGQVSCDLVKSGRVDSSMMLLEASGLLDEIHNSAAYEAIVSVSEALCSNASDKTSLDERSMKSVILANSLLNEHALVFCPASLLPFMMFLSNLVDVAGHMLLKSDCGVGEKMEAYKNRLLEKSRSRRKPISRSITNPCSGNNQINKYSINLHPSWNTSDGLLLPPTEALTECMAYCKGLLAALSGTIIPSLLNVHHFLETRGAHSISLRMLACASVVTSSKISSTPEDTISQQQAKTMQKILFHLAERSLGGSGTGDTNARIDYSLAVPSLLNLHVKVAFKAYKRCLPSAMSRRDFDRVIALANVGSRAAGSTSPFDSEEATEVGGWKSQGKFASQCQELTSKAYWWNILQRFGVYFDVSAFNSTEKQKDPKDYISSLVFNLIRCASKSIADASTVQLLAADFCRAFDIETKLSLEKHIEFLLTKPERDQNDEALDFNSTTPDIRDELASCAAAINCFLKALPNEVARSSVLRKSLVSLEAVEETGKDFERYAMILSIYNSQLRGMLLSQSKMNAIQSMCLQQEIERIDRRLDALGILSSFFDGRKVEERPYFQKCFQPLPPVLEVENNTRMKIAGVLGLKGSDTEDCFDPMKPIEYILQSEPNPSTTSTLGPICIALGLPSGYIHARVLIERMRTCKSMGGSLPPFETEVAPIIKKLKISTDGAELAEWCASQYEVDSAERLACLSLGLHLAIKASTEAEHKVLAKSKRDNQHLVEQERIALERVQRMTRAKSSLLDIITVKNITKDETIGLENSAILPLINTIVEKARINDEAEVQITPEQFAENLLIEGSLVAATASLDANTSMDMTGLCLIASIIHKACIALEENYSHINLGYIARTLVRRWLLHGDEGKGLSVEQQIADTGTKDINESMDCSMDQEDTMDFVLDLNMAASNTAWSDDAGANEPKLKRLKTMTADEEQTSLKPTTTREISEYLSSRVGLRVAFVMSFAKEFHPEDSDDNENIDPNEIEDKMNRQTDSGQAQKHARYLLKLVFSRSNVENLKGDMSLMETHQTDRSHLGTSTLNTRKLQKREGKALTFAMRHHALRAAAALCPEGILNKIIAEEDFFRNEKCSLSKCCFGSFVAKEIEAMGLPLPHSDLIHLSTMHQPSYGRTIWRQRSSSTSGGFKGRLMLLILELALHEGKIVDVQLVNSILSEVISLNLPRTNLLVCECVSNLDNIEDLFAPANKNIGTLVMTIVKKLTVSILHDISVQESTLNENNCTQTLHKLGSIITSFMNKGIREQELSSLIDSMTSVATRCSVPGVKTSIYEVAAIIIREMKGDSQAAMLEKLCSSVDDASFTSRISIIVGSATPFSSPGKTTSSKDCLWQLLKIEHNFNRNVSKAIQRGWQI